MSADDIHILRLRLDQIVASQEVMAEAQKQLAEQQSRLMTALVGDDLGTTGIVKRLATVEKHAEETDKKLVRWGSLVAGASLTLGLLKDQVADLLFRR